jgi:hypothetical protein
MAKSLVSMVTLLQWIANKFTPSNSPTKWAYPASCNAIMVLVWNLVGICL